MRRLVEHQLVSPNSNVVDKQNASIFQSDRRSYLPSNIFSQPWQGELAAKKNISPNICSPKSNYSAYSLSSYYARTSIQGIAVKQVRSSLPPLLFALPYLERGQHLSRYYLQHDQQAKVSKIQERSQCSEWCLSCCRFKFWAQCSGKYSYSIEYFG